MEVTGIILAGGKSSRMEQDKGLVDLNGKPMIQYIIDVLKPVTSNIIIIANNDEYKSFGYPVYKDIIKEKGPVGGIYTALNQSKTEKNLILSCDTPFVTKELLLHLIEQSNDYDIIVPNYQGKTHPLIGIYSKSIQPVFKHSLDKNLLKLSLVIEQTNYKLLNLDAKQFKASIFKNINTLNDLKNITDEN